jgi:hypothetical protein
MLKNTSLVFATFFAICLVQNAGMDMVNNSNPGTVNIDGPYVFFQNDSIVVNFIQDSAGEKSLATKSISLTAGNSVSLNVNTDIPGKTFGVTLRTKLNIEKSEFANPKKMLVISDIEGNFAALRKLLQGNGVIDENFNWTYNKGHLVLAGDFVDRGNMITEVLWLIYSLEEKAKAAGGYVHFILGNHEIMNMSNDLRYVPTQYLEHAAMMHKPYMDLFGQESAIGRWLATKNVAERIGNFLFLHGGVSNEINDLNITLKKLNELSRPYYTDTTYDYRDKRLNVIYSDLGPFWYRGYYLMPKATAEQVDYTLNLYNVRHISTGHTIIADEISSLFDGKLFNTDVHHASGHSEALLIENEKMWRVNSGGEKAAVVQR